MPAGERNVDTAYTVIEEYMERGRAAARLQTERSEGRDRMSTDPRYTTPYRPNLDLMAPWVQMTRFWADAVNAWMFAFVPGSAAWAGITPGLNKSARIEVRVTSKPVTAVTVDLHPGADALLLTAEPAEQAGIQVNLDSDPGVVRVNVSVPDDQPPGSQSFVIQDAYKQPRGTLQVKVLPEQS